MRSGSHLNFLNSHSKAVVGDWSQISVRNSDRNLCIELGLKADLSALELKQDKLSEDQSYVIDREVYGLQTHIQTVGGAGNYTFKSPSTFDKSILIEQGILSSDGTTWIYPPVRVTMGSNVTFINSGAFQNATNLLSFDGENVVYFQSNVFRGCTALKSVNIPNAVTIGS
jgi:hypothetical protein